MGVVTVPLSERKGKLAESACEVRDAIRRGQVLICEQGPQIHWYLSGGDLVPCNIARIVLTDPHIVGTDDCLFPNVALSQTYGWRA